VGVHFLGQFMTALLTPALENVTPTLGGHAFSESVDASPTSDFWLIGSFWHDLLTSMHNNILIYHRFFFKVAERLYRRDRICKGLSTSSRE
jgi:hypothetical protein